MKLFKNENKNLPENADFFPKSCEIYMKLYPFFVEHFKMSIKIYLKT